MKTTPSVVVECEIVGCGEKPRIGPTITVRVPNNGLRPAVDVVVPCSYDQMREAGRRVTQRAILSIVLKD